MYHFPKFPKLWVDNFSRGPPEHISKSSVTALADGYILNTFSTRFIKFQIQTKLNYCCLLTNKCNQAKTWNASGYVPNAFSTRVVWYWTYSENALFLWKSSSLHLFTLQTNRVFNFIKQKSLYIDVEICGSLGKDSLIRVELYIHLVFMSWKRSRSPAINHIHVYSWWSW